MDLVVSLELQRHEYLVRKLLGRRVCSCGRGFNVAHVECKEEGVYMPALLPKDGQGTLCDCGKRLTSRPDDTEKVIRHRLRVYEEETLPLIEYYRKQNVLRDFKILRGLEEVPKLEKLITESLQ